MGHEDTFVGEDTGRPEYALSFPFASDEGAFRAPAAVVGLSLLSLALVPTVLLNGYLLRVQEAAARQRPAPPAFHGALDTAKEGVRGSMALFPLFVVFYVFAFFFQLLHPLGNLVLFAGLLYYTPAFLTVYSTDRSPQRLYSSGQPFRMAHSVPYLLGGLVFVPVSFGLSLVAVSVDLLLLIPLFVAVCTLPLFTAGYWGYVYSETIGSREHLSEQEIIKGESFFDERSDADGD